MNAGSDVPARDSAQHLHPIVKSAIGAAVGFVAVAVVFSGASDLSGV